MPKISSSLICILSLLSVSLLTALTNAAQDESSAEVDLPIRTWSDRTGNYRIRARLRKVSDGNVYLLTEDGREIEVPLGKLSDADTKYLNSAKQEESKPTQEKPADNSPDQDDANPGQQPAFTVPGLLSIGLPGEGYQWAVAQSGEANDVKFHVLVCRKAGSTSAITLIVEQRLADSDERRVATTKGHFNGLLDTIRKAEFEDIKVQQPEITTPMPKVIPYAVKCSKPDGRPVFVRAVTLFGTNTYSFQAIGASDAEAIELVKVLSTLTELTTSASN